MSDLNIDLDKLISRLLRIHPHKRARFQVDEADLLRAESALQRKLPQSFWLFLLRLNGIAFNMWEILRVVPVDYDRSVLWPDIVAANEHLWSRWQMPTDLLAFMAVGDGDHMCFRQREGEQDRGEEVVWWRHDEPDAEEAVMTLARSFAEWLEQDVAEREEGAGG